MKIKKSTISFVFLCFFTLVLALFVVKVYEDSEITWKDESTWETAPRFKFPAQANDVNYSLSVDESMQTTKFEVTSCTLYKSEIQGHVVEYSCSLTASQILMLNGKVENFTPSQDIIFTFEYGKDPMPSNFFGVSPLDELTFQIVGKNPLEVALTVEIKTEKPKKTILKKLAHFVAIKLGRIDTYPTTLLSWQVEDSVKAGLTKAGGEEKFLEQWRLTTIAEINKELLAQKADILEGQELLNVVRNVFQYQNSKCAKINGETTCTYSYPQNAADALMYYLYAQGIMNPSDKLFKKIENAVKMYTVPFIDKYNKNYVLPVSPECADDASDSECMGFYQIVNAYQYSICPIQDVIDGRKDTHALKLFTEYVELSNFVKIPTSSSDAVNFIRTMPESQPANESGFPDFESSVNLNVACYSVTKFGITDKSILALLEKRYFESLAIKLLPSSGVPLRVSNDVKNYLIAQQVNNKYTRFPFVGDSSIVVSRNATSLESLPQQIENKVTWGNVPLSLTLFYLSLNTTK